MFIPTLLHAEPVKEATIDYISRSALPMQLNESSGLIFWNGKLWSHNDSSGTDSIYGFSVTDPLKLEQYYTGAPNIDWEAIEQDEQYIYIGDFGNNKAIPRTDLCIFRITKKSLLNLSPVVDTIYFHYPEQTDFSTRPKSENTDFDCEAFIVSEDSLYLFTKQWIGNKTALYSLPKTPGTYAAKYISTYNIEGLVTDATYLESKNILALCCYSANYLKQYLYIFYDFEENDFFNGKKYKFNLNLGIFPHQTEGITTIDGGTYYVTNEYQPVSPQRLHIFDINTYIKDYLLRPESADEIQGPVNICRDKRSVTYTIPTIPQAVSYEWTLPEGAVGGSISNSIEIVLNDTVNMYGKGKTSSLTFTVHEKTETPHISISDSNRNILYSSSSIGNQWYDQEGPIKGVTDTYYEVTTYGEYYVVVTVNGCSSAPSNIIKTGCVISPDEVPLLQTAPVHIPTDLHSLYKTPEKKEQKRYRIFFWRNK